jgi:hypothetical protein
MSEQSSVIAVDSLSAVIVRNSSPQRELWLRRIIFSQAANAAKKFIFTSEREKSG